MTTVGVDWAAGRWVTVRYVPEATDAVAERGEGTDRRNAGSAVTVGTEPAILNVLHEHRDADRILVDIPVGLPGEGTSEGARDDGRRACDVAAREALPDALGSSVFPVPCRAAVFAADYETASDLNRERLGRGLSSQSWGIVPRIREVDVFLRKYPDRDLGLDPGPDSDQEGGTLVAESHPEVCFAGLAADDTSQGASKLTDAGAAERRAILADHDPALGTAFDRVADRAAEGAWKRRITTGRLDDVLDAMALALTAAGPTRTLPADPPTDAEGLPMRIVAPDR